MVSGEPKQEGIMAIRRSNKSDALEICLLAKSCYKTLPYNEYGEKEAWERFIGKNCSYVYVEDDKIVGHAAIEINNDIATLCRDFVSKDYRRRGMHRELTRFRMVEIEKMGIKKVRVYVTTNVDYTQSFFIKEFGFEPCGLRIGMVEDVQWIGQRESLVLLKKGFEKHKNKPHKHRNFVPIDYNEKIKVWEYGEIPIDIDMSKIKLSLLAKNSLNI